MVVIFLTGEMGKFKTAASTNMNAAVFGDKMANAKEIHPIWIIGARYLVENVNLVLRSTNAMTDTLDALNGLEVESVKKILYGCPKIAGNPVVNVTKVDKKFVVQKDHLELKSLK